MALSGVSVVGGAGGCSRSTHDGPPLVGPAVAIDPPLPVLDVTGSLHPASQVTATVHGEPASRVCLLVTDGRQWLPESLTVLPRFVRPDPMLLPLPLGAIDGSGQVRLDLLIPNELALQGFSFTVQAAVYPPDLSSLELSNAVTRIIAE